MSTASRTLFLTISAISMLAAAASCSPERRIAYDGGNIDAAVADAKADTSSNVACRPSETASDWTTPSSVPATDARVGNDVCHHPEVHADCSDRWCRIPAGCFLMGSPESEWARAPYSEDEIALTLTHPFLIQQYEATRAEWLGAGYPLESGASPEQDTGDCTEADCPAASLTWFDVLTYANNLSEREGLPRCYVLSGCSGTPGKDLQCNAADQANASLYDCTGYRLPMETEWEYATRAGSRTAFYSGGITSQGNLRSDCCLENSLNSIGWYCGNSSRWTHPVGQKAANAWGLFDTAGNAAEWTNDPPVGSTPQGPLVDYGAVLSKKSNAVLRGGSAHSWPASQRSAADSIYFSRNYRRRGVNFGFRLVRSLPVGAH
jgi:formylglycine-generating enzyme required for sulfatase activity